VCDPCAELAEQWRTAQARLDGLKAESAKVDARLTQLRGGGNGGELGDAQRDFDRLNAEYDKKLGDPSATEIDKRGTFINDGTQEVRYQESGDTVNIVTVRNGSVVPGSSHRSPYMTSLKARRDAAKAKLERLQAEAARLDERRKELDKELPEAQAAADAARQKLEDCLKQCAYRGTFNFQLGLPGFDPGGSNAPRAYVAIGRNLLDRLPPFSFSAVRADGVPYSIARPGAAGDDRYQLFIVLSVSVHSGPRPGTAPPARRAQLEDGRPGWAGVFRHVRESLSALGLVAPGRVLAAPRARAARLEPGTFVRLDGAPQPGAAGPAISVTATGASSGDALTLQVVGPEGEAMQVVAPDGLVLQAVRQAASRPAARDARAVTAAVTGFCLDYHKPPPPAGAVYQVAPQALQERFRSLNSVLQAGRALSRAGLLHPDSDPRDYATFVQQWALWTRIEGWDFETFTNELLDRTRRNAENAGARWTDQMRDAVRGAARNRFNDILSVLLEADALAALPQP
jgi:hypothetical protein